MGSTQNRNPGGYTGRNKRNGVDEMKNISKKRGMEIRMKIRNNADKAKKTKESNPILMRLAELTGPTHDDQLPDKGPERVNDMTMISIWRDNLVLTLTAVDKQLMECGFAVDMRDGYLVGLPISKQLQKFTMNDLPVWDINTQRWLCPQAVAGMTPAEVLKWMFFTGGGGIYEPLPWDEVEKEVTEGGKS